MTAPLPPYQPNSPAWQAGYEHAKRQAFGIAVTAGDPAHRIAQMRPEAPVRDAGMDEMRERFARAPSPRAPVYACAACDAVWRTEWQRDACCTAEPERIAPTTPPTRVQAAGGGAVAGQGTDALCGQQRAVEAAFLSYIQEDNGCEQTSTPCRAPKQCGCAVEMDVAVTMRGNEGVVG